VETNIGRSSAKVLTVHAVLVISGFKVAPRPGIFTILFPPAGFNNVSAFLGQENNALYHFLLFCLIPTCNACMLEHSLQFRMPVHIMSADTLPLARYAQKAQRIQFIV